VACNQLGFKSALAVFVSTNFPFQQGISFLMTNLQCSGNESSLHECSKDFTTKCAITKIAGVICLGEYYNKVLNISESIYL